MAEASPITNVVKRNGSLVAYDRERIVMAILKAATACTPGDPAEVMLNVAKDVGAQLIVVGSTGAGLMAEMVGSTTLRLIKKSKIPVLVVPKG